LSDGRQQVTALFLPGDIFDLNTDMLAECGYTLRAVTEATVAELARGDYERLAARNPDLGEALTWGQLEQIANQTEWLANLGQRSAIERLAHFFCEIYWRLTAVGRARGDECDMPLTQHLLAEVLGMTPVHLNRSLQQLRESGIIDVKNKKLRIIDGQALADRGMFDADYLELKRAGPTNS
jgi:CRP-like cAMP-binding protein